MINFFIVLLAMVISTPILGYDCKDIKRKGIIDITLPIALMNIRGVNINTVTCHRNMKKPLTNALECAKINNVLTELRTYDGCYCYRNIAGTNRLSQHAFGMAIDFNARTNGYGRKPTMNPTLVRCFEKAGFRWGGRWKVPDGMHFELRRTTDEPRSKNSLCTDALPCDPHASN